MQKCYAEIFESISKYAIHLEEGRQTSSKYLHIQKASNKEKLTDNIFIYNIFVIMKNIQKSNISHTNFFTFLPLGFFFRLAYNSKTNSERNYKLKMHAKQKKQKGKYKWRIKILIIYKLNYSVSLITQSSDMLTLQLSYFFLQN